MSEIKVDKWDIIIACSSGALSGAVDDILCTDFGWDKAHDLGEDDVTFFTGEAYGTNDSGLFVQEKIDDFKSEKFPDILFKGAFKWGMHLLSDVAGSSGSIVKESDGTGIL